MKLIQATSAAALAALVAGCSTTVVDTNREARIPVPTIATTGSLATVEVGEKSPAAAAPRSWATAASSSRFRRPTP